jgi:uncharacterized membrane protein YhiD involved in acid resistance
MLALSQLHPAVAGLGTYLQALLLAAFLGVALGLVRPVGNALVPRSPRVVQAQVLLAVVGALIIMVVADSLARAFAVVGAAGLVRYRAPIRDPKDAGVMLVALALGLTAGSHMYLLAVVACLFVIALLWLLETLEPATSAQFEVIVGGKDASRLRPEIERALNGANVQWELLGSSLHQLRYATRVPLKEQHIRELSKLIRELGERHGHAKWKIKKMKPLTLE